MGVEICADLHLGPVGAVRGHAVRDEDLNALEKPQVYRLVHVMRERHEIGMCVVGDPRDHVRAIAEQVHVVADPVSPIVALVGIAHAAQDLEQPVRRRTVQSGCPRDIGDRSSLGAAAQVFKNLEAAFERLVLVGGHPLPRHKGRDYLPRVHLHPMIEPPDLGI